MVTTTEALRHLLKVVRGLDLPDDHDDKPTEQAYQAAIVQAELALQIHDEGLCGVCGRGPHDVDDPQCKALEMRDGTLVDIRKPWSLPA